MIKQRASIVLTGNVSNNSIYFIIAGLQNIIGAKVQPKCVSTKDCTGSWTFQDKSSDPCCSFEVCRSS